MGICFGKLSQWNAALNNDPRGGKWGQPGILTDGLYMLSIMLLRPDDRQTGDRSPGCLLLGRGVQYVHWVMHKCIVVKVGGRKRNTHKVCKKQVNLSKTGGKFVKVGGRIIFTKQGENVLKQCENRGEIENFWSMTKKKVIRNFGG